MNRKAKVFLITALCAASAVIGASASELVRTVEAQLRPDFTIVVDGDKKSFKNVSGENVYPLLYEGTTYLPVRAIGELMGKTVYWYEDDKRIELKEEKTTVTDADVIVNGSADKNSNNKDKNKDNGNNKDEDKKRKDEKPSADSTAKGIITADEAKKIALDKAGLGESEVVFEKVKLDTEDGRVVYEVEFKKGKTEYSADVLASDGTVVSWEVDED